MVDVTLGPNPVSQSYHVIRGSYNAKKKKKKKQLELSPYLARSEYGYMLDAIVNLLSTFYTTHRMPVTCQTALQTYERFTELKSIHANKPCQMYPKFLQYLYSDNVHY